MKNTFVIAMREFGQRVRSRGFILGSIAMPLIFLVIWFVSGGFGSQGMPVENQTPSTPGSQEEVTPVGYVDLAGLIREVPPVPGGQSFQAFADQAAASQALQAGEIDMFYVIPVDYREQGELRWVGSGMPVNPPSHRAFEQLLAANLLPGRGQAEFRRLENPFNAPEPVFVSTGEQTASGTPQGMMLPFLVVMLVMLPLFTSGGYLLQSLTQEKGSRIMEILLVSVRPRQLLTGKLLGLGALIFVQYLVWAILGLAIAAFAGFDFAQLGEAVSLAPAEAVLVLPFALGGFILYAGLMAGIGAMSPDLEASRTWIFVITLPMMLPIYVWFSIVSAPHGALAVALSLFPFSSPVAMLMRLTSAAVPAWQLALSLVLLALTAVGVVLLMARLFRAQILLSGESLSLPRFVAALRG